MAIDLKVKRKPSKPYISYYYDLLFISLNSMCVVIFIFSFVEHYAREILNLEWKIREITEVTRGVTERSITMPRKCIVRIINLHKLLSLTDLTMKRFPATYAIPFIRKF